ncbi:PPE family protein [Mycobacterium haemophilum DSM 44634]|uniref:PPE family protein n=1 Tax=Mycobacterium haemophilum TaxID=29311 RepID=UPI00065544A6|nr:PPE family protein [Mycobacterium haemophilum]AKN18016.1 hypothetical protein B586_17875 [Mycobacterium haemophilum DSM 44634]
MDFGMLPPEINSARMYTGAGPGPLLAAAAAWDAVAAELISVATSYASVVSGVTGGSWSGPASASMAAASAPYVTWMRTTATQAEQTATQARAAASAYESAFAMTVPPPVIAANRSLLMSLIATNILGQNIPAIAATEAHYGEMWAQDAATMYGYAGASAAASTLTPFTPPQPTTNPAGLAGQAAAVAQATGTSAATNTQATLSQAMSAVPGTLQGLASPLSTSSAPSLDVLKNLNTVMSPVSTAASFSQQGLSMANTAKSLMSTTSAVTQEVKAAGPALAGGFGSGALWSAGSANLSVGEGGAAVSAGLGRATSIGALSAPQAWAAGASPINPVTALPTTGLGSTLGVDARGPAGVPPPMAPITNMAANGTIGATPRYGFRPTVIGHSPAAG